MAAQWQEGSQKITYCSFAVKPTQAILASACSMPVSFSITIELDALITRPRISFPVAIFFLFSQEIVIFYFKLS